MPVPPRTAAGGYHYHAYDYAKSKAFTLSPGQAKIGGGLQFYSLKEDLYGLLKLGLEKRVPNIALSPLGGTIVTDTVVGSVEMLVLSFGKAADAPRDTPSVLITGGIH